MTPKERDEIEALLQEVESQSMLRAPKNFKAEVLAKISKDKEKKKKRMQREFQFKVCVGMAAALLMLFTLDLDRAAQGFTNLAPVEKSTELLQQQVQKQEQRAQKVIADAKKQAEKTMKEREDETRKKTLDGEDSIFNLFKFLDGGKKHE